MLMITVMAVMAATATATAELIALPPWRLNVSVSAFTSAYNRARNVTELYLTSPCNQIYENLPPTNPRDAVYKVENPLRAFNGEEPPRLALVTADTAFPVYITTVPDAIAEHPAAGFVGPVVAVSSGRFPLPAELEAPGEIFLLDTATGRKVLVTAAASFEDKWYYSKFYFYDVDGDGDDDVLCTRSREIGPIIPLFAFWGQLVWFEQPNDSPASRWTEHVLVNPSVVINDGPDGGSFSFADVDGDGVPEVAAAESWSYQVKLYWTATGRWSDAASIRSAVVSPKDAVGLIYDAHIDDVDGDGRADVLVTNHIDDDDDVYYPVLIKYAVPADVKTNASAMFPRVDIDDALGRWYEPGKQSPGYVITFRPAGDDPAAKPRIAIGGDGTGEWYVYTAASQSSTSNDYDRVIPSPQCPGDNIKPYFVLLRDDTAGDSAEPREIIMCGCLGEGLVNAAYYA